MYKYLQQNNKSDDIELQLLLVIESAMVFDDFLHIFQRTGPMIQ